MFYSAFINVPRSKRVNEEFGAVPRGLFSVSLGSKISFQIIIAIRKHDIQTPTSLPFISPLLLPLLIPPLLNADQPWRSPSFWGGDN